MALNKEVDGATATEMAKIFLECIIAPGYSREALDIFKKKENLRVLHLPSILTTAAKEFDFKRISGGLLVQEKDFSRPKEFKVASKRAPTPEEMVSLEFSWPVVKHVKSNAIVLARGVQTVGLGAGQMSPHRFPEKLAWIKLNQQQPLILANPKTARDGLRRFLPVPRLRGRSLQNWSLSNRASRRFDPR